MKESPLLFVRCFLIQFHLQMLVRVFASGIDTRTIYGFFLVSGTQAPPSGLVVIQSVQMSKRFGEVTDQIKHHRIVSLGQTERYGEVVRRLRTVPN